MEDIVEMVLPILYLAVLACQIAMLVHCIKKPSPRGWAALYVAEVLSLGAAFLLMHYFDALPGRGMMPGLTWFAETLYSMGATALYGGMLVISLIAGAIMLLKRKTK